MGGGGSKAKSATVPEVITLETLKSSGRYITLPRTGGDGVVHLIAVVPCSSKSVNEVAALIDIVQPDAVYVDLFPEQLEHYTREVKEYEGVRATSPDGIVPTAWLTERRRKLALLPGLIETYDSKLGIRASADIRALHCEDAFFRLLGVGRDEPYFPAIAHAIGRFVASGKAVAVIPYPVHINGNPSAIVRINGYMSSIVGPGYSSTVTLGLPASPNPDVMFQLSQ